MILMGRQRMEEAVDLLDSMMKDFSKIMKCSTAM